MEQQESDISNEAAALADILRWSADQPAWQRDALRRLCGQIKLDAAEITALVAICKGADKAAPLDANHVRDPAASHAVVSLGALHSLSNINALAPGERLTFGKSGLTVIYGDNGAGKSGYARVLKQLCRARSPKGELDPAEHLCGYRRHPFRKRRVLHRRSETRATGAKATRPIPCCPQSASSTPARPTSMSRTPTTSPIRPYRSASSQASRKLVRTSKPN